VNPLWAVAGSVPPEATIFHALVGDGSKPDFLPEQNRTGGQRVKWPRIGVQTSFGGSSRTQKRRRGWSTRVTLLRRLGVPDFERILAEGAVDGAVLAGDLHLEDLV